MGVSKKASPDLPLFAWQPPPKILLFPSVRRVPVIMSTAATAARAKHPERTIVAYLTRVRAAHIRKGVPTAEMERDLAALEMALYTHVARFRAGLGGAA